MRDKVAGDVIYTTFCDDNGHIRGDLTVAKISEDEYYCVLPAADTHTFMRQVFRYNDSTGTGAQKQIRMENITDHI